MWPFQQTVVEVETPRLTPAQRLAEVEAEYRAAEREFNTAHQALFAYAKSYPDPRSALLNRKLFCRVNAMSANPVRAQMEAARAKALAHRNELLQQRAYRIRAHGVDPAK